MRESKTGRLSTLLPIGVFLALYLGLGIALQYIFKTDGGFYGVPITAALLCAVLTACLQNRNIAFEKKLEIMAKGVGDKNIVAMLLILLAAGIFSGIMGRVGAQGAAYFMLSLIPARFSVAALFAVSCLVSTAMGTSLGTIALIIPIAGAVSDSTGFSLPLCAASVAGGSMFGDNLSFISDTTIAACGTQGCKMRDKFAANFRVAFPAALGCLIILLFLSFGADISGRVNEEYTLAGLIPYILVLIGGIAGINVFIVLLAGIISAGLTALTAQNIGFAELLDSVGDGAAGMYETITVTVLVAALCGLMREYGGFDALLWNIRRVFKGYRGGQLGIGVLVSLFDIAAANNTVAIVMAGPIAKEISAERGIEPRRSASILDTFSCIIQGVLPYGAQLLYAESSLTALGKSVSAIEIIPFMFYPMLLLLSSVIFIISDKTDKKENLDKTADL